MKDGHLALVREPTTQRRGMQPELLDALNAQLRLEFESAYMYLGISTYFFDQNLDGFGKWFRIQSQEELEHGMKIYNYLLDRDAPVMLPAIEAAETRYASSLEAVAVAYAHEEKISASIHALYALAQKLTAYDTSVFLQWFIQEQVEEEALFKKVKAQLVRIEQSGELAPLLALDNELGSRKN